MPFRIIGKEVIERNQDTCSQVITSRLRERATRDERFINICNTERLGKCKVIVSITFSVSQTWNVDR